MIFIYQKEILEITKKEFDIIDGNKSDNFYIIDENELKTEISDLDYLINQFSEPVIEENNEFKRFKEKNENSIRNIDTDNLNNNFKDLKEISEDYIKEFIKKQNALFKTNIQELNEYQSENENFKLSELSTKVIFNLLNIDDGFQGYSSLLLNRLNINGNLIPKFLRILENESQEFINDKILNYSKRGLNAFDQITEFVKNYKETNFDIESASALALVENVLGK